ncbi:MAG: hypothetical protein QF577_09430 [Phycisphaerae bacterium]|nr:hypothetical protein [Phycisphaerae bacterium]
MWDIQFAIRNTPIIMLAMPVWNNIFDPVAGVLATSLAPPRPLAWITVVIAIVMILAITVVSCWNPRRGHRD